MSNSVLYDAPGPRARTVNLIASLVGLAGLAWIGWIVYAKFDDTGQWAGEKWSPFLEAPVWENLLLPGIVGTLKAFAVASVLALVLGAALGIGRMSQVRPIRLICAGLVEFFRSIPLLLLMFFLYYSQSAVLGIESNLFAAVVLGLMLYNGSVLAEVIRAGVQSLPKGQGEAGMAIGLRPSQVMNIILLPQAVRAMLPAIIAQLVVLLKDTALGYILGYSELLNTLPKVDGNYHNLIPAALVIAMLYIAMNGSLGWFATWLERRLRSGKKAVELVPGAGPVLPPVVGATPQP